MARRPKGTGATTWKLTAFCVLCLTGCVHTHPIETIRPQSTVSVKFHEYPQAQCYELGVPKRDGLMVKGCARVMGDQCVIVGPKPYNWGDRDAMATLGHELLHCLGAMH